MPQFVGSQYTYVHDEDQSDFMLVNGGRDQKFGNLRQRFRFIGVIFVTRMYMYLFATQRIVLIASSI